MKRLPYVLAFIYFIAMAVACTFPGLHLVNRIRPFVLGMPFMMFWFSAWVVGAMAVFALLYRIENQ